MKKISTQDLLNLLVLSYPELEWKIASTPTKNETYCAIQIIDKDVAITNPYLSSCSRFEQENQYGLLDVHAKLMRRHNLNYDIHVNEMRINLQNLFATIKSAIEQSPHLLAEKFFYDNDLDILYTGGGCMAFAIENADGSKIMCTEDSGSSLPSTLVEAYVCLYDKDEKVIECFSLHDPSLTDHANAGSTEIANESIDPLSVVGSLENTHAIESLILWLSDNESLGSEITFSNEDEVRVRSPEALIAIKALLPQFAHLQA